MIISEPVRHLSYVCGVSECLLLVVELVTVEKRELLRVVVPMRLKAADDVVFLVRADPTAFLTGAAL